MNIQATSMEQLIDQVGAVAVDQNRNRSRLDSQALLQLVRRTNANQITEALNQVYAQRPSRLHPSWRLVQHLSTAQ